VLQVASSAPATSTGCFRCRSAPKEAAPSAAISPPMPAARCIGVGVAPRNGARAGSRAGRRADPEFAVEAEKGTTPATTCASLHRPEGTLGINHRSDAKAVFQNRAAVETAYVGLQSPAQALNCLSIAQNGPPAA